MSLFALLAALALAYYRPLPRKDWLRSLFAPYAGVLERNFNDGQARHGVIAGMLAVLLPVLIVAAAGIALAEINPLLGLAWDIGVLYVILRFGRFGSPAEGIANALRAQNLEGARAELATWQACETGAYTSEEVARVGIEATLRHAHHDLFAPLFWFLLLGPAGALLYRLAYLLKNAWSEQHDDFGHFPQRLFDWLDWLPARFTAGCFAVVGDFEDAVYCWRTQAALWPSEAIGIILASGAGALGVRLGEPLTADGMLQYRPELGLGDVADADYLSSAVGLVWRVLVLMAGLLLMMTFAHWLGS
ncbi:cobalamin biosynthesis protein CbiB [mine drainage metagenome]|uniref:Cobalamin biosynthesis protein CbiB n=1 Tax=mine drainage metagenome TaxID=410659 RepID=A0A1J5QHE1_9ZZZZ